MSIVRILLALCLLLIAVQALAQSPATTTTTLSVAPTSSTLSQPVTLTAVVSPPPSGGKVTFYDGTTILGVSAVGAAGTATLTTSLLPSGTRSLQARYWGGANLNESISNVVPFTVTTLQGNAFTAGPNSPFPVGSGPNIPAVGDFNGDGKPDLAFLSGQLLTVWLGDGKGGFTQAPQSPPEAFSGATIAVGDFDGDGNLDVAVPDNISAVAILLGDGKGGFKPGKGSPFPAGIHPFQAVVADFNGDGKPDVAVSDESGTVSVLLGDGNGRFTNAPGSPFPVGNVFCLGIVAGDFNGDGLPDIAVVNVGQAGAPGAVTILLGDGNGGFTTAGSYPVGDSAYYLAVGDLNGDGNPDLAVANFGANFGDGNVTVLLGDGKGGFYPAAGSPVNRGSNPLTLALGDFNGDGKLDLAVTNELIGSAGVLPGTVSILLGDGNGGFSPALQSPFLVGGYPLIAVGDFNLDGLLDFATTNLYDDTASVMLGAAGLTVALSQTGVFAVNQLGTYSLTVSNRQTTPSSGLVTVTDTLPSGLAPQTATGGGWGCSVSGQTVSCTRTDPLPAGGSYAPIALVVMVVGSACPNVPNTAAVASSALSGASNASISTPISGCVTVTQQPGTLVGIVNQNVSYTLILSPVAGTALTGGLTVTDTLPAGLVPIAAAGEGWNCTFSPFSVVVSCAWPPGPAPASGYPPITINVNVTATACSSSSHLVQVKFQGAQLDYYQEGATTHGCLTLPPIPGFSNTPIGKTQTVFLNVASSDTQPLDVSAQIQGTGSAFSVLSSPCFLAPGGTCQIELRFSPPCLGPQSATLVVLTNVGASYQIQVSGTGVVQTISFALDGQPITPSINPNETHTVSVALNPSPGASCGQQPVIALSFSPPAPDGTYYDVKLTNGTLQTGTVAGTITLTAEVGGVPIVAQDHSGSVMLKVPPQPGVVQTVSISNQTGSSFGITVSGYSTPRDPSTQVCFSFAPASGANLNASAPICALQQDIGIWYERTVSYATGSQFQGSVTVSFSGSTLAIGQIKVWIENAVGASASYCQDFQSGASQTCR